MFYKKIWVIHASDKLIWYATCKEEGERIYMNSADLAQWIREVHKHGGVVVVRDCNVDDSKSTRTQKSN